MNKPTQVTQGTWRAITLVLFSVAIFLGVLGLAFGVAPIGDPTKEIEQSSFWIVRGCLFGLAFSFGFLGYSAYLASRRKKYLVNGRNLLAVLGVALGILLTSFGVSYLVQSSPADDVSIVGISMCVSPCLILVTGFELYWLLRLAGKSNAPR